MNSPFLTGFPMVFRPLARFIPGALAVVFSAAHAALADPPARAALPQRPAVALDPQTALVLEAINSLTAYQVPDLELKEEANYANTPEAFRPFGSYAVQPFRRHFLRQLEYTGPGRAIPEPARVDSVKLGFIGPIQPTVSVAIGGRSHEEALGIMMLRGAKMAIEEANARGGYRASGIPFELIEHNDNGLWGASGNEIIKMAYDEKVWAILGTIDGANTHIAIRVALKAEIPVMNTGDTDPTLVETNIPWIFRCIGDDRRMGYLLVDYMYRKMGHQRVGIIRSSNRYGRFGVREIRDGSRRLGHPIVLEMLYPVGGEDFSVQLERLHQAGVDAMVHWGSAADGGRILKQMRETGMNQPFYACDRCVSEEFLEIAGPHAEGVVCTYPWDPTRQDERLDAFRTAFQKRFGVPAETFACHGYDGMSMLIWAVEVAGLNRAKIRDVLAYRTQPWPGITGDIVFSAVCDDVGEVFLARRENGAWKYYSRQELDIPGDPTQSSAGSEPPSTPQRS